MWQTILDIVRNLLDWWSDKKVDDDAQDHVDRLHRRMDRELRQKDRLDRAKQRADAKGTPPRDQ